MSEKRESTRFQTLAKVKIKGSGEQEFPLKDLSVTGCKIECPAELEIMPNKRFSLQIIPETNSEIDSFVIKVESKWVRVGGHSCESGFSIVKSPKGKHFQSYVDYLSWRYSHGKSMTSDEPEGILMP